MLASVHIADLGPRRSLPLVAKRPSRITAPGLRHAELGLAAPLSASLRPKPDLGRVALVAFWDDDGALDRFLADSPVAAALAGGWSVRLEPLRAWGGWPGLPDDLPKSRTIEHDGPVAVLTMGWVKPTRLVPFIRASAKAEGQVVDAPGLMWATGLARPPFVSTCSLWESSDATRAYAFAAGHAHNDAIAIGRAKPFHKREAFIRIRPYAMTGHLDGGNPLPESIAAEIAPT